VQKPSLLWLLSKWPVPPYDGSRVASFTLISELARSGVSLDIAVLTAEEPEVPLQEMKDILGVRSVTPIKTPPVCLTKTKRILQLLTSFFSSPLLPVTVQRFAHATVASQLLRLIDKQKSDHYDWQAIVYEGVHTAAHLNKWGIIVPGRLPHIYRAQNCEAQLWRSRGLIEKNYLLKIILFAQAFLMKRLENSLVKTSAGIAAISPEDLCSFKESSSDVPSRAVPVGLHFDGYTPCNNDSPLTILFIGKLDWYPNRDGLLWFLQKVWPQVIHERPDTRLIIVGSGDGGWLENYADDPNITMVGYAPSTAHYYEQAHVTIVPIHYGGGIKIKAIEAAQFARVSLITPTALSGLCFTPGETALVAQDPTEWSELLIRTPCSRFSELGIAAYNQAKDYYNPQRAAESFLDLLAESLSSSRENT
jgi:polysaccharide biosynthesis protein PslH